MEWDTASYVAATVLVLIVVLGISIPFVYEWRQKTKQRNAWAALSPLEQAIQLAERGRWPGVEREELELKLGPIVGDLLRSLPETGPVEHTEELPQGRIRGKPLELEEAIQKTVPILLKAAPHLHEGKDVVAEVKDGELILDTGEVGLSYSRLVIRRHGPNAFSNDHDWYIA